MRFSDIPGHSELKQKLIRSVREGKVAHAQLFAGKAGALYLPLALAYNTYLHCQQPGEHDACGTCAACTKNAKYIHPDVTFVFPVANVKGDKDEDRFRADLLKSWRQFLIEQPFGSPDDWLTAYGAEDKQAIISREESRSIVKALSLTPFESRYKTMIIWQPETMHPSASNGILKILEEPPPQTVFLLATQAADHLMATILSRTQRVTIPLLQDDEIAAYLANTKGASTSASASLAREAEGDLRVALMDWQEDRTPTDSTFFFDWMTACYQRNYGPLLALAEQFHEQDRMQQRHWLQHSLRLLREVLLLCAPAHGLVRGEGPERERLAKLGSLLNIFQLESFSRCLQDALYQLERNASAKMTFMDTSLKISAAFHPDA